MQTRKPTFGMIGSLVLVTCAVRAAEPSSAADLARHLVAKAGFSRGVCALLGCCDGAVPLELARASGRYLHVREPDGAAAAAAREVLDTAGLSAHVEKAAAQGPRQRLRPLQALKPRWIANELRGSDPVGFVVAGTVILVAVETPRPRSRFSRWELCGLDPESGSVRWRRPLPAAAVPGGMLVTRHGRVVVVLEDGAVVCFR